MLRNRGSSELHSSKVRSIGCLALLLVGFLASNFAFAQDPSSILRKLREASKILEDAQKQPPAPKPPSPSAPPAPNEPLPKAATPTTVPTSPRPSPSMAGQSDASKYEDAFSGEYDRARHTVFIVPEATTKLAEGERRLTMRWAGLDIARVLSNPYIPIEPYELVKEYYLTNPSSKSRNNDVRVTVGIPELQGFFREIDKIHCTANDELLVQGSVGFGAGKSTFQGYSSYSYGLWRVDAEGAIKPMYVKPYKFAPCGDHLGACESQHPEVWKNVLYKETRPGIPNNSNPSRDVRFYSGVEDKHGNVWAITNWSVVRFNKDGSQQVVLDRVFLNADSTNVADKMPPTELRYDKVRDEVVFMHGFWGSGEGAFGIWRLTQQNEAKEVLRLLTKGQLSKPSANLVPGKWEVGLENGFSIDSKGNIWFTGRTPGRGYPGQAYQVVDSIKNLKKLPYYEPDQIKANDLGSDKPVKRFEAIGRNACFDSKDNMYFTNGAVDVLRRDAVTGKVTTWVK